MAYIFAACLLLAVNKSMAQSNNWTSNDVRYQNTITNLSKYLTNTPASSISQDSLKNYIYVDYAKGKTSQVQMEKRSRSADTLIKMLKHFVDSVGYENIDVKPVADFKSNATYYQPFEKELKKDAPNSLAYFDKSNPSIPLGSLLFDQKTGKLMSWVVINQSGYYYFLTFDML
jgi:hypothetical protein